MATRVLGVDPGSAATGWALVVADASRYRLAEFGVLRPRGAGRAARLAELERGFAEVVARVAPDCAAVETSFAGRNPRSGLQLAESRGVILAALGRLGVKVWPYSPAQVKAAIVGHGQAEKRQISYMVCRLLGLAAAPPSDAADAMAAALTHIHTRPGGAGVDCPCPPC